MPRTLLSFLLLGFALPGLAQPTTPPLNLRQATCVLPAGAIPVDVAIQQRPYKDDLLVAAQGTDKLYRCLYNTSAARGNFWMLNSVSVPEPLSLLALPQATPAQFSPPATYFVLPRDGWTRQFINDIEQGGGIAFGRRTPTDRLLRGNYEFYSANSVDYLDLACWQTDGSTSTIALLAGQAMNQFNSPAFSIPARPGDRARTMVTTNLRNRPDGLEDLIVPLSGVASGAFAVWYNLGRNNIPWDTGDVDDFATGPGPCVSVAVGDVDGDGVQDVVTAGQQLSVHRGSLVGSGFQQRYQPLPGPQAYAVPDSLREVVLADLSGDGRPELLALTKNNLLHVFVNTSAGSGSGGALFASTPYTYLVGQDPALVRVADADEDGDLDVLLPCRGDHAVSILWNDAIVLAAAPAVAGPALAAYPNPARGRVQVAGATQAELRDLTGRLVRAWPQVAAGAGLEVAELPRGVYVLRLAGGGTTATRRLVLE